MNKSIVIKKSRVVFRGPLVDDYIIHDAIDIPEHVVDQIQEAILEGADVVLDDEGDDVVMYHWRIQ